MGKGNPARAIRDQHKIKKQRIWGGGGNQGHKEPQASFEA